MVVATLPRLRRADEIAEELGLDKFRLYSLCRSGTIPHVRIGRSIRFDANAIAEWIRAGGSAGSSNE